jgi:hypothetical protein
MDEDSEDRERRRPPPPGESRPGKFRRPNGRHIRTPSTRPAIVMPSPIGPPLPRWTIEAFEADDGTVPIERFVEGLPEPKYAALRMAIRWVLAVHGLDLAKTEWLKPLGAGLHEFRVRRDARQIQHMFGGDPGQVTPQRAKLLLRVFVHFHGDRAILLLGGYDKGASPKERRQQREIAEARRLLAQFKERQRRRKHER